MIDLFDEASEDLASCGYETVDLRRFGATCSKLFVDSAGKAKKLGFGRGHYFILNAPKLSYLMDEHRDFLVEQVRQRIDFLFKENKIKKSSRILLVGIGNPSIIPDSFGTRVVEKIEIMPFKKNNRLIKLMPNIFANTGMKAYDVIHLVVAAYDIDAVILFDSLATKNLARLGKSIQFNDAGLTPGSAMNNFGLPINKGVLGVPCLCVGVPMMISSSVFDKKNEEIVLTEKDAEEKVEFLAGLIAQVMDEIL